MARDGSERVEWDRDCPGLGLRQRDGRAVWIVQARIGGRSRKMTLGPVERIERETARDLAIAALAEMRASPLPPSVSLGEFADRHLSDCRHQWKPATLKGHRNSLDRHVLPVLRAVRLADLDREAVLRWRAGLTCPPGTGNRALAVLSGLLRHAEVLGLRPPGSNPCSGLRRRASGFAARYLSRDDYARLGAALNAREASAPAAVALIRFLALTGCRLGEARLLRRDKIHGSCAVLPDSKTGPRTIWFGPRTCALLETIPHRSGFVFHHDGKPIGEGRLYAVWSDIRADCGFGALRLHDLRHSYASVGIAASIGLRTIGGLLGHSEIATTAGYAHLADGDLRAAADRVGMRLAKSLGRGRRTDGPSEQRRSADPVGGYLRSRKPLVQFCAAYRLEPRAFWKQVRARQAMARGERP